MYAFLNYADRLRKAWHVSSFYAHSKITDYVSARIRKNTSMTVLIATIFPEKHNENFTVENIN